MAKPSIPSSPGESDCTGMEARHRIWRTIKFDSKCSAVSIWLKSCAGQNILYSHGCFHNHSHSSIVVLSIYCIYFSIQSVLWMHFYVSWLLPFNCLAIACSRRANILKIYLMFSNFFQHTWLCLSKTRARNLSLARGSSPGWIILSQS